LGKFANDINKLCALSPVLFHPKLVTGTFGALG